MDKNRNKSAFSLFARSNYDYAQEEQNLRCAFLCELSTRARVFILTLVMAMTVLVTTGVEGLNVYAETGTVYVATYDQLREALEDTQGVKTIVVDPQAAAEDGEVIYSVENDEDNGAFYIGFDGPLTVSHDITITTADDVDVFFARSDSFRRDQGKPALFNIDRTGSLELDGLITMTGEEVTTAFNDREFVFSLKSRDGTGEDNDAWNRGQVLQGGYYIQNNGGEYNLGDDVILEDFHTTDDVEGVEPIFEKETNSLFGAKNSDEEATEEKEEVKVVAPAPKRMMKNALMSGTTTTKTVATYDQLKAALQDENVTKIIIDKSGAGNDVEIKNTDSNPNKKFYLPVDAPLEINRAVEITATNDVIIARSDKFTSKDAIFKVTENGNLNLNGKITMTGDKVSYKYNLPVTFGAANLSLGGNNTQLEMVQNGRSFMLVDGLLVNDGYYLGDNSQGLRRYLYTSGVTKASNVSDEIELRDPETGATITSLEAGQEYVLYGHWNDKYIVKNSHDNKFSFDANLGGATVFTATSAGSVDSTITKMEFNVENPEWTSAQVGKENGEYGGFFIDAPNGGTVNIQGDVILQNLRTKTAFTNGGRETKNGVEYWTYTDDTVTNVAPVYIGGESTLNMSGGTILNNRVGYGAVEADSSSSIQWLKKRLSEQAFPTNTAGGIIASGDGTTVNITGKAKISNNQADAGALIIMDKALVTMDKVNDEDENEPEISGNIGWHHSGGALVENGATLHLIDGKINDNIAWGKGGAVWATEWGTNGWPVWDEYPNSIKNTEARHTDSEGKPVGGNFIMDGGELRGNFAFTRGGAIEVESNGVTLNGGDIAGNRCKSLGGAMYIEGDSPIYTYTVVIQKGFISGNEAVWGANPDLDKRIEGNQLAPTDPNKRYAPNSYHFDKDFAGWGADGDGGGVWLCSMGGTSVFTSHETDEEQQVVIDNNTADRSGDDFFVSAKKGAALIQNLLGDWYYDTGDADEPLGDPVEPEGQEISPDTGKVIYGRKGLVNGSNYTSGLGIQITGNKARDGGGIACNGTIVLGTPQDVYRYETELELTKTWDAGLNKEKVTLQLFYEYPEGSNKWHKLTAMQVDQESGETTGVDYEVDLDGNEVSTPGSDTSNPAATNVIYQTAPWKARASIPYFTQHKKDDGTVVEVPLYKIKKPGTTNEYYDLVNSKSDIEALYNYYKNNPNAELEVEWNIQVREKDNKYKPTPVGSTTATSDPNKTKEVSKVTVKDAAGNTTGSISVFFTSVTLNQTINNSANGTDIELDKVGFNNAQINGAQFKLYKVTKTNGNTWDYVVNTDSVQSATSNKGKLKFEGLQAGKYFLFEETPAAGYKKPNDPWLIEVTNNDVKVYTQTGTTERNGAGEPAAGKHWDKVNRLSSTVAPETYTAGYFTNKVWPDWFFSSTPVTGNKLVNEVPSIKIKKTKNDGTTGLGGARFAFGDVSYEDNNTKYYAGVNSLIKNGNELVVVTSNANTGEIDLAPVIQALNPTANPNQEGQGRHINSDEINLLMYELSSGALHKQKTTPWLVTITNKGVVKITEHSNPYTFNISPVNESTKKLRQDLRDNVSNFSNVVSTGTIEGGAFVKNEPKTYEIEKIGPNNEPVNGAKFNLYKVDDTTTNVGNDDLPHGKFKISSTTPVNGNTPLVSANGKITLPITERGAYLLFETEAPNGYVRSQLPWGIYVNSQDELSGWTINENSVTTVLPLVTNTDGSIKTPVTDIEITCEQMNVPAGKIKNDKFNVELTKKNLDEEPVDGAVFELYEVGNVGNREIKDLIDADWTSIFNANDWDMEKLDSNRVGAGTEIKSKDGGKISLPITKKGVYFLFETTAASSDYVTPVDPWVIVVSDYGKVVVRKSDGNAKTGARWWKAYKYTKLAGTEITNTKQIKINKVKGEFNSEGNLVLETTTLVNNAKFKLYNASEEGTNITRGVAVSNTEISSTNGIISLPQSLSLQGGKKLYWLEETAAAPGYVKADKPWVLWVQDGQLKVIYRYKEYAGNDTVAHNLTNYVEAYKHGTNATPYIHNEQYILKVDGNTLSDETPRLLAGATFEVYPAMLNRSTNDSTKTVIRRANTGPVTTVTSDAQGRIYLPTSLVGHKSEEEVDPSYANDYPTVRDYGYVLIETKAPDGYKVSDYPWWITVEDNGEITVKKTTYSRSEKVSNGWSYYYVKKPGRGISAAGYTYWYTSDFSNSQNVNGTGTLSNTPNDFELKKVDGNTKKPLKGAKFDVYKAEEVNKIGGERTFKVTKTDEGFVGETSESNEQGIMTLPEDVKVWRNKTDYYIIYEKPDHVPEGYALAEEPWLVAVHDDGNNSNKPYYSNTWSLVSVEGKPGYYHLKYSDDPTVECDNNVQNYPSVNLVKADADTVNIGSNIGDLTTDEQTKFLEGVEFRLYEATRNNNGVWSWNENKPIQTVKIGPDGTTVKNEVIKSNEKGVVELGTLKKNSYYVLKEVTPIDGYLKPDKEWRIITDGEGKLLRLRVWDGTQWIDGRKASADGKTPACNIIVNARVYNLPSTGGMGTYWFMVIGMGMMTFAVTTLISRKFSKKKL